MFYGLLCDNSRITNHSLITRHQVLGEDDLTPWLTTDRNDANQKIRQMSGTIVKVVAVQVSPFVPWKIHQPM